MGLFEFDLLIKKSSTYKDNCYKTYSGLYKKLEDVSARVEAKNYAPKILIELDHVNSKDLYLLILSKINAAIRF
jgi:hypothetical protein